MMGDITETTNSVVQSQTSICRQVTESLTNAVDKMVQLQQLETEKLVDSIHVKM